MIKQAIQKAIEGGWKLKEFGYKKYWKGMFSVEIVKPKKIEKLMDYKSWKKLKDAGFPLEMTDHELCVYQQVEIIDGIAYHIPNLSELIEECKTSIQLQILNETEILKKITGKKLGKDGWTNAETIGLIPIIKAEGKTPEEAVKNLWFKLNK